MANDTKKTQPAEGATSASGAAVPAISIPVGELESFIAKLGEAIGAGVAKALAAEREAQRPGNHKKLPKREVPPEFKGPHTYIVGPKGAYQGTRRFQQGERITVVDQFPASDWTPIEDIKTTAPQSTPVKSGRAADQTVG